MGVINNFFQLLFNYFSDQLSYEIQLPLEDNHRNLRFFVFINAYIICFIQYMKSSVQYGTNEKWN